jgi:hypothetical protein
MRDTTPYASILPLNGFIMVIANDSTDDARLFRQFAQQAGHVVNTARIRCIRHRRSSLS